MHSDKECPECGAPMERVDMGFCDCWNCPQCEYIDPIEDEDMEE